MNLLPNHLQKIFNETKEIYSRKVIPLPTINLKFIEQSKYLADARANPLNQLLIEGGLIQDFDSEYPGFLVVYEHEKSPLMAILGGGYGVSISYDLAKKWLKPFTTQQVFSYLRHGFAHEITHIMEKQVREKHPLSFVVNNYEMLDSESYAEQIADMIEDSKDYKYVEQKLWEHITKRAQRRK